jgi:hypothetical protein
MTAHVIAPLKLRRMDHEAVLMRNGEVMIAGGRIGGWDGAYLTEAEIYNPATGTWRVIDPMFQSRISGFSLVRFSDGTVLAAGGRNAPQSSGPAAEVLDPVAMTWQSVAPMKVPCVWHGGVEMPFDLYMITGGFYDADWRTSTVVTATPTCEWYDKWHGRWYYAPRLNMQRGEHGALYLHDCGNPIFPREIVLVVGGITGNNTITNTAEVLDITEPAREHYMASQEALASVASPSSEDAGNVRLSIVGNGGSSPAVTFTVGTAAAVRVDLVASDGHTVATLADGTYAAGTYRHNVESGTLPSGVYFVRMTSAGLSRVERLVVVG